MDTLNQNEPFINNILERLSVISGIDNVFFILNSKIVKSLKEINDEVYKNNIINILNNKSDLKKVGDNLFSNDFHTYTLLNESGLLLVLNLDFLNASEHFHMIIVAGEKKPVDLINLLKITRELRNKSLV